MIRFSECGNASKVNPILVLDLQNAWSRRTSTFRTPQALTPAQTSPPPSSRPNSPATAPRPLTSASRWVRQRLPVFPGKPYEGWKSDGSAGLGVEAVRRPIRDPIRDWRRGKHPTPSPRRVAPRRDVESLMPVLCGSMRKRRRRWGPRRGGDGRDPRTPYGHRHQQGRCEFRDRRPESNGLVHNEVCGIRTSRRPQRRSRGRGSSKGGSTRPRCGHR